MTAHLARNIRFHLANYLAVSYQDETIENESGHFLHTAVVRACSGYDEGFLKEIDGVSPVEGPAFESESAVEGRSGALHMGSGTDSMSPMECEKGVNGRCYNDL